jgi:hypothetical protein
MYRYNEICPIYYKICLEIECFAKEFWKNSNSRLRFQQFQFIELSHFRTNYESIVYNFDLITLLVLILVTNYHLKISCLVSPKFWTKVI